MFWKDDRRPLDNCSEERRVCRAEMMHSLLHLWTRKQFAWSYTTGSKEPVYKPNFERGGWSRCCSSGGGRICKQKTRSDSADKDATNVDFVRDNQLTEPFVASDSRGVLQVYLELQWPVRWSLVSPHSPLTRSCRFVQRQSPALLQLQEQHQFLAHVQSRIQLDFLPWMVFFSCESLTKTQIT